MPPNPLPEAGEPSNPPPSTTNLVPPPANTDMPPTNTSDTPPEMPIIARIVRGISFGVMVVTGSSTFGFYLAIRNKAQPLLAIGGVPPSYVMYGLLCGFAPAASVALGITCWYFYIHPFWDLLHLFTILGMLGFFAQYLHFEPTDVHLWGPLAADLGIVISTGFRTIYYSADRGLLRKAWDRLYGSENSAPNETELRLLSPSGRPTVTV